MKKSALIILLLISFNTIAQHNREIVMWEVQTRVGGLLLGISETKDGADAIMLNFQKRNKGSKYDISDHAVKYQFNTVSAKSYDNDPIAEFKARSGNRSYKVLSPEDVKTIEIAKNNKFDSKLGYFEESGIEYEYEKSANDNFVEEISKQQNQKVVIWEVETKSGSILSGTSKSKDEADAVMADFQKKNEGTKYDISIHPAKYEFAVRPIGDSNTDLTTKSKPYKLSSPEDEKLDNTINSNKKDIIKTKGKLEIVMWEVQTRVGGLLFGISETKDRADAIILNFQKRNKDSKYDISDHAVKYQFSSVSINKLNANPITKFKSHTPDNKPYKVLSTEDLKSIEISKNEGIDAGVDYYVDARGADRAFVKNRLKEILTTFDKYRIKKTEPKYLASSTD